MKKQENITAVIKEPNQPPRVEVIKNDLETLQGLVGGYIELVRIHPEIDMIINEEGKLIGLESNFETAHDVIVGTAVFVSHEGEEFSSLSDKWVDFTLYVFEEKERMNKNDRGDQSS